MSRPAVAEWDTLEDDYFDWDAHHAAKAAAPRSPIIAKALANSSWTTARVQTLTKMWNEKAFASDIATVLGISRNAVIGKANRLGLASRDPIQFRRVVKYGEGRKLNGLNEGTDHERPAQTNRC